jgi:Tol biopolymer transport system component
MFSTLSPARRTAATAALVLSIGCGDDPTGPALPWQLSVEIPTAIVFDSDWAGNRDVFVLWPDGRAVQVTSHPAFDGWADWSPDGQRIAFYSTRDGNPEIYVADQDGSSPTNLSEHAGQDAHPDWSPDGTRILFHSDRAGDFDLWVMNADGSNQERIPIDLPGDQGFAVWSPDGTRIAFHSQDAGAADIYVVDADGGGLTRLTETAAFDWRPAWSPDGTEIAFMSDRTGSQEVMAMNADGSELRPLTQDPASNGVPAWSPDGEWIAYASWPGPGVHPDIYVMRPDGTGRVRLLGDASFEAWPDWRPF